MKIKKIKEFLDLGSFTTEEALNGIISGDINFDLNGHKPYRDYKEIFKSSLIDLKAKIERCRSGSLQGLANMLSNEEIEVGDTLPLSMFDLYSIQCKKCGEYSLQVVMSDRNEFKFISRDTDGSCIEDMDSIDMEINVPSGELIFTNFFRNEEIYSKGNSINSIKGIIKEAEELAKLDIGYGQMSNMSVDVWKKDDGTEVIIANAYDEDWDGYDETKNFKGYKKLGNISMDVWRWMCADKEVLKKHNEEIPDLKPDSSAELKHKEYINCDVIPGRWKIEHYYVHNDIPEDRIYSRLYKI